MPPRASHRPPLDRQPRRAAAWRSLPRGWRTPARRWRRRRWISPAAVSPDSSNQGAEQAQKTGGLTPAVRLMRCNDWIRRRRKSGVLPRRRRWPRCRPGSDCGLRAASGSAGSGWGWSAGAWAASLASRWRDRECRSHRWIAHLLSLYDARTLKPISAPIASA